MKEKENKTKRNRIGYMKRERRNGGEVMSLRCRKENRGGLRKNVKKVSERERKMKTKQWQERKGKVERMGEEFRGVEW